MVKFREIIRLHELGRNQSEIAQSCGVARSTVQDYTRRANAKGVSYAQLETMSDSEAQAFLGKQQGVSISATLIAFKDVHRELSHKGVTLSLLWQEGLDRGDWTLSYGQFCRRYNQWKGAHNLSMRQVYEGGDKTFLACALADHLCKQGLRVRYLKTAELLTELKFAKADGSFPKFRKQLASFELVILDEWLRDTLSANDAREVLDFLDDRYRQASCLFASQFPVTDWHQKILDPTLADAILDRIVHDSVRISLRGESMRKLTSKLMPTDEKSVPKLASVETA